MTTFGGGDDFMFLMGYNMRTRVSYFLFWSVLGLCLWRQNFREAEGDEMKRKKTGICNLQLA